MKAKANSADSLHDRIELVRQVVRDEADWLEGELHPEDNLHEIADGCVPIHYNDIAAVFASEPDLGFGPRELHRDPEANIFEQLQVAIYERLYDAAVDEADKLGLLEDERAPA